MKYFTNILSSYSHKVMMDIDPRCQCAYSIVWFLYINPNISNARLNDLFEMLSFYSMKDRFVGLEHTK